MTLALSSRSLLTFEDARALRRIEPWVAFVRLLLGLRGPSTVRGFVIPVGVDSVKGEPIGPRTHIGQEVVERTPSLTDHNSTPAVPAVRGAGRIIDSPKHRSPRTPSAVVRAFVRGSYRARRSLRGALGLDLRSGLVGVGLALHRMSHSRAMPTEVLAHSIPALVHGSVFTAATTAEKWLQRSAVLLVTLGLRDPFLRFFGVTPAFSCHFDSVPTQGDDCK